MFYYCTERLKKLCFTTLNLAVKNLGTRLDRYKQSYFSFLGQNGHRVTKVHQGLLQTKDSGQRLSSISLPAVFEWSLSADSCFETTSVTAKRINLNKTENLQVKLYLLTLRGIIEKRICMHKEHIYLVNAQSIIHIYSIIKEETQ